METTEQSYRDELYGILSDVYKSAYGMRPRGIYGDMTVDDIKKELDHLGKVIDDNNEMEAKRIAEDLKKYESTVKTLMSDNNIDRKTAVRWLVQAEDIELDSPMDIEGYLWSLGFDYTDYGRELKAILIEIMDDKYENNEK